MLNDSKTSVNVLPETQRHVEMMKIFFLDHYLDLLYYKPYPGHILIQENKDYRIIKKLQFPVMYYIFYISYQLQSKLNIGIYIALKKQTY
jgi:hypothetical protein